MEKLLLYCTKEKPFLHRLNDDDEFELTKELYSYAYYDSCSDYVKDYNCLNGTIVAECECNLVEEITSYSGYKTKTLSREELCKQSCLDSKDMYRYFVGREGYALYLKNIKVFDRSKELNEYFQPQNCCMNSFGHLVDNYYPVQKAPQNMMVVYDKQGNRYILLSIRSVPLFKILRGAKTIEVRRKILNCLKELIR